MRHEKLTAALVPILSLVLLAPPVPAGARLVGSRIIRLTHFVPAGEPCEEPTMTPVDPFEVPACPVAAPADPVGLGENGGGQLLIRAVFAVGRQIRDLLLQVDLWDVVVDGTPFNGSLILRADVTVTDRACGGELCRRPVLTDLDLTAVACGTAASPALPAGRCRSVTSANAIIDGFITPGRDATFELNDFRLVHDHDGHLDVVFVEGVQVS
jgi:hypothetical protein